MKKSLLTCAMEVEQGQGMIEYGMLIALVALVVVVGLWLLGPEVSKNFVNIAGKLSTIGPAAT